MNKQGLIDLGKSLNNELENDQAYVKGINNFVVSHESLQTLLDENCNFRSNAIILVSNSNCDGASALQKHYDLFEDTNPGSLDAVRKAIYSISDMIFSASEKDRKYFLGQKTDNIETVINKCGSLKPCVHGSDAHSEEKLFVPSMNRYCWIKSDLTFEGLKQLKFEPDERVRIQESNPSYEFDKPSFSQVSIKEKIPVFSEIEDSNYQVYFKKDNISLNKNLVSIIGGRGEGKSLLINYIGNMLNDENTQDTDSFSELKEFSINYSKNNKPEPEIETYFASDLNFLDFLFIGQNKLKNISDKKIIGKEIKELLNLKDLQFSESLNQNINKNLSKINNLKNWFIELDEDGDEHHSKDFIDKFKNENQVLLKSITTKENKVKLIKYTQNIIKKTNIEKIISRYNELISSFEYIESDINKKIDNLNKLVDKKKELEQISFKNHKKNIKTNINFYISELTDIDTENKEIKIQFAKDGFTGDISSLLDNANSYQSNVEWANKRLEEIENKEIELSTQLEQRDLIGNKMFEEYRRQSDIISNSWEVFINRIEKPEHKLLMESILSDRDIKVEGKIIFNENTFYNRLREYVDLRIVKNIRDEFNISNNIDFQNFIQKRLKNYIEGDDSHKIKDDLNELIFDLYKRSEYLYVEPQIYYKGKILNKLSAGQRGTVYLCLKLATGAFSKPIIFDQPEDDLDNEFIIDELVEIFKKIKKYRQTIIVSHNANLVVNTDSEQIIIANNSNEHLSYSSGSLENPKIIEYVCKILEGGHEAFKKRENRYNISK